jgi:prolyl 4-hydroxylase
MTGLWLRILWSTRCNYYNCNYHYNYHYRGFLLVLAVYLISTSAAENEYENENEYGVDISFPGHHKNVSTNYAWLPHNQLSELYPTPSEYQNMPIQPLGDRQKFYNDMMQGCVDKYKDKDKYKSGTRTHDKGDRCWENERDRIEMALRQPQSMVNYTTMGFQKIKAPKGVWNLVQQFWEKNKDNWKPENWPPGNTYTNHWVSPTYMVSVEDSSLRGGGFQLKQAIWDAAKQTIEDWTGEELTQCSLYGVRVYTEGAVLNTHVDRLPLVSSAIFNVAADLDEPWPLEVIGHDGKAYNITMEPGDMVLYESHSVLHGRPFPLKGRRV